MRKEASWSLARVAYTSWLGLYPPSRGPYSRLYLECEDPELLPRITGISRWRSMRASRMLLRNGAGDAPVPTPESCFTEGRSLCLVPRSRLPVAELLLSLSWCWEELSLGFVCSSVAVPVPCGWLDCTDTLGCIGAMDKGSGRVTARPSRVLEVNETCTVRREMMFEYMHQPSRRTARGGVGSFLH
jgi:hypothetical protein